MAGRAKVGLLMLVIQWVGIAYVAGHAVITLLAAVPPKPQSTPPPAPDEHEAMVVRGGGDTIITWPFPKPKSL